MRLFDKGEMDTYRDDTNFALLAADKLRHFLLATLGNQRVAMATAAGDGQVTVTTADDNRHVAIATRAGDSVVAMETGQQRELKMHGTKQEDLASGLVCQWWLFDKSERRHC